MRQPSRLIQAVLVGAQILTASSALVELIGPKVFAVLVLTVAACQGGLAAYQRPPDLDAARRAVRIALLTPLEINGSAAKVRQEADIRSWDAVHTALDVAVGGRPPVAAGPPLTRLPQEGSDR